MYLVVGAHGKLWPWTWPCPRWWSLRQAEHCCGPRHRPLVGALDNTAEGQTLPYFLVSGYLELRVS